MIFNFTPPREKIGKTSLSLRAVIRALISLGLRRLRDPEVSFRPVTALRAYSSVKEGGSVMILWATI